MSLYLEYFDIDVKMQVEAYVDSLELRQKE